MLKQHVLINLDGCHGWPVGPASALVYLHSSPLTVECQVRLKTERRAQTQMHVQCIQLLNSPLLSCSESHLSSRLVSTSYPQPFGLVYRCRRSVRRNGRSLLEGRAEAYQHQRSHLPHISIIPHGVSESKNSQPPNSSSLSSLILSGFPTPLSE